MKVNDVSVVKGQLWQMRKVYNDAAHNDRSPCRFLVLATKDSMCVMGLFINRHHTFVSHQIQMARFLEVYELIADIL